MQTEIVFSARVRVLKHSSMVTGDTLLYEAIIDDNGIDSADSQQNIVEATTQSAVANYIGFALNKLVKNSEPRTMEPAYERGAGGWNEPIITIGCLR